MPKNMPRGQKSKSFFTRYHSCNCQVSTNPSAPICSGTSVQGQMIDHRVVPMVLTAAQTVG